MAKLVIFGIGKTADVALDAFVHDSDDDVVGFVVDRNWLPEPASYRGLPVVAFEDAVKRFPPATHRMFVAVGYHGLNAARAGILRRARGLGYGPASYVSSRAALTGPRAMGGHCFVMAGAAVQAGATLGTDVWVWSNVVVGHHATIGDHCWLASGCAVGGATTLGARAFVGMNAVLGHEITLGERVFVGAGARVLQDAPGESVFLEERTERYRLTSSQFLRMTRMV